MTSTELAMRWSDLDTLKHVNNVVYVDYAMEAWPELRNSGLIPEADPRHVRVDYRFPVLKSEERLHIDNAVDGSTLQQSIYVSGAEQPAAIVSSDFGPVDVEAQFEPALASNPLMLRYSDLDHHWRINMGRMFELFQEARVLFINQVMNKANIPAIVIARADVHIIKPLEWQLDPVMTQTWVKHVGGSSFSIRAQMCIDGQVSAVAETIMVAFDGETQKAASLTESQRADLRALMLPE